MKNQLLVHPPRLDFNSIKVRLKHTISIVVDANITYFNSIKVRLKRYMKQNSINTHEFQFHKGTIKTFVPLHPQISEYKFQFHKGTIKTSVEASAIMQKIDISIP